MLYAGAPGARRPRPRGDGRGPPPLRFARRGLGRGDHPPARVGDAGVALRDRLQRRGVRRLARHRPRRHRGDRLPRPGPCRCGSTSWPGGGSTTSSRRRPTTAAARPHGARSTPTWSASPGWRTPARTTPARPAPEDGPRGGPGAGAPPAVPDLDARARRGHRAARRRGPAARHHLHLQPRRCESAVQQCLYAGLRLNDEEARHRVREIVEERTASIPTEDLHVLGYHEWLEGLERGIAAHHAGMLPTFKEVVEELFVRGLVKAVFAPRPWRSASTCPPGPWCWEKLVKRERRAARRHHPR